MSLERGMDPEASIGVTLAECKLDFAFRWLEHRSASPRVDSRILPGTTLLMRGHITIQLAWLVLLFSGVATTREKIVRWSAA